MERRDERREGSRLEIVENVKNASLAECVVDGGGI